MSAGLLILLVSIQVIIFAVLIYILRRIFTQNVSQATKHLEGLSQDFDQKHEEIKKKSEEAERIYQEKISTAQDEASKQKMQIIKEAQDENDKMIQQARLKGQEIIQQADKTGQMLLSELDTRIEKEAIVKASELLTNALPAAIRRDIHARLLSALIDSGFVEFDKMRVPDTVTDVCIDTAFSLSADERTSINNKLKKRLGREFKLEEKVNPKLVAGIMVTAGSLVLDGSLNYRIQEEARARKSSLK